jgi:hypothetical protein
VEGARWDVREADEGGGRFGYSGVDLVQFTATARLAGMAATVDGRQRRQSLTLRSSGGAGSVVCERKEDGGFVGLGPFGRDNTRGNATKEND